MVSVCYVLSYYSPNYIRTRTLVKALQRLDHIKLYQCRNTSVGFWRYFQTLAKLIITRIMRNPDFFILGFRGYEYYWFVRLITIGKPLIFDHMMSPYDSLVNERKKIKEKRLIGRLVYLYEKITLASADIILTDTENHKIYFQNLFEVNGDKIVVIPVGADEELFFPGAHGIKPISAKFEVLFYGSFLPLHGMDVILRAAKLLLDYPIRITLIGGRGARMTDSLHMIQEYNLKNVRHFEWVDFEQLPVLINNSDLGLGGPFGNTGQAQRVITGKTFQFLAMAKPVIIGSMDLEKNGFVNKENCLVVPQGNDIDLAEGILWAYNHQDCLASIGRRGYELYHSRYSINQIAEKLKVIIAL